jgi:hypothetical protein
MAEFIHFILEIALQTAFILSLSYLSYALCCRWFLQSSLAVRLCATCVLLSWLLSFIFSILMSTKIFMPIPAAVCGLLALILSIRILPEFGTIVRSLSDDLTWCREIMIREGGEMWRIAMISVLMLFALMTVRTLALPVLGWDSLTYHSVKAGLWVQAATWKTLNAPGGWESYKSFFGGGESFMAWAMLFLHSDFLAGIPDLFFWVIIGFVTAGLAGEFGLSRRTGIFVGMAFLCTLDVNRMVGTGYVDNCANAFVLCGFLFFIRFARSKKPVELCFSAAAFGLASSVKIHMLGISAFMVLPAIVLLLRSPRLPLKYLCICLILATAPLLPWLALNYMTTGYPLGYAPLRIGSIHLGMQPPNLVWAMDRPDLTPYHWDSEARAIYEMLRPFGFTTILAVLGVPGLIVGIAKRRLEYVLALPLLISLAFFYFSSSFSVVRLVWASANGRFLLSGIIITATAGLPFVHRFRHGRALIKELSLISIIIGVWTYLQNFVIDREPGEYVFLLLAVILTVLICLAACLMPVLSSRWKRSMLALSLLFCTGAMYGFARFKDSFRFEAYSSYMIMHQIPTYWVTGFREIEREATPSRIAFTLGPAKVSDGTFIAPFLGRRFQNTLFYVSPYESGMIVPHHPDSMAKSTPSFIIWINALRNSGATHILCLFPESIEIGWILDHPDLFDRLSGEERDGWGLFRIRLPDPE